jgi:hypothetical protein
VKGEDVDNLLKADGGLGLDGYLRTMSKNGTWGDGVMVSAAALLYKRPIILSLAHASNPITIAPQMTRFHIKPMYLGYTSIGSDTLRNHYVSLHPEYIVTEQCPMQESCSDPIIKSADSAEFENESDRNSK